MVRLAKICDRRSEPNLYRQHCLARSVEYEFHAKVFPANFHRIVDRPKSPSGSLPNLRQALHECGGRCSVGKRHPSPRKGWLTEDISAERGRYFEDWHPEIRNLIAGGSEWGGWPIFAVPSVGTLAHGALCLIGDAGHAMVPYGAQGGASAVEGCRCIGSFLQKLSK